MIKMPFKTLRLMMYVFIGGYCVFILTPLSWMVFTAFKKRAEIFSNPSGLPSELYFGNFERVFSSGIGTYFLNSLITSVFSVTGIVAISTLAAYALARIPFKGRMWVYMLIVASYAVPLHAVLVPMFQLLDGFGLLNTLAGLILPYIAFGIPFTVILLYAFFLEFPKDLEEAAKLDGCSQLRTVFFIVLPLSKPALLSAAIFQVVFVWNEFLIALLILTSKDVKTLPLGLTSFQGQYSNDWGAIMAAVLLSALPIVALYLAMQKHFVRSLTGMGK
ncbi:carbohydrate ABC transporter permease [Pseudovibrio brasiliensis]|uniref:sn-glycerol-3-phosphate transport system permease protein UgpE n=1 Tax=Pseudovibrio brasiliensis TaxID=1898042 RepID=A0ABX8AXM8_9HYPH|nr:carbohydrate ABC transporter permease [Pseudovibrio brasiliensis]QUS58645.1 carbohydrate ABC transporter permease [Pseudovibrio brasiliensis]